MRCACGNVFNTDDSHIGKALRCRCGRTVTIARPPEEYAKTEQQAKARATPDPKAKPAALRRWRLHVGSTLRHAVTDSVLAMASRRHVRRWTARLTWLYFAAMLVTWVLLVQTSEQFLPATLLAYGPRFLLLAPLALLLPLALFTVRGALIPLALAALVGIGPIMGGHVSRHSLFRAMPASPPAGTVRVLTYNTMGLSLIAERLPDLLSLRPDFMAFQECSEQLFAVLERTRALSVVRMGGLCTASRWPILFTDSMPRRDLIRSASNGTTGSAMLQRAAVATPHGTMFFVNLHLETARKGLSGYLGKGGFIPDNVDELLDQERRERGVSNADRLESNVWMRERESERAALWSVRGDKSVPVIVAGDFNLPAESTIYRRHWGDYTDAFASSGTGFGFSKSEGLLLHIRVDHILTNTAGPTPAGAWMGRDYGSDHLPVIADLRLRR